MSSRVVQRWTIKCNMNAVFLLFISQWLWRRTTADMNTFQSCKILSVILQTAVQCSDVWWAFKRINLLHQLYGSISLSHRLQNMPPPPPPHCFIARLYLVWIPANSAVTSHAEEVAHSVLGFLLPNYDEDAHFLHHKQCSCYMPVKGTKMSVTQIKHDTWHVSCLLWDKSSAGEPHCSVIGQGPWIIQTDKLISQSTWDGWKLQKS